MLDIVVIGDSIAKGVGSSNTKTKNFGALIGEKVDGKVTNLGITGLDSGQLIEKLKTEKFQEALKDADVVFVSIGSNDLLKPFLKIVADSAGATGEGKELYKNLQKQFVKMSKNDPLAAGDALANAVKEIKVNSKLQQGVEQFPENFQTIISQLKEMNPDAIIYVNNIYNPYYGVAYVYEGLTLLNIHELCESYIVKMNETFSRTSEDYKLMDMYSVFQQSGYTNVNPASLEDMSKVNFDPHPNDAGYQLMADYMYTQMDSIAPKAELLWKAATTEDIEQDTKNAENSKSGSSEEALEEYSEHVPVTQENLSVLFSERVRIVEGKELYLTAEKETFTYTLTGQEVLEGAERGTYVLTLSTRDFLGDKLLEYDTPYELVMEEGAFKDKGNNTPAELVIGEFQTQEDTTAHVEANSVTVVNQSGQNKEQDSTNPYTMIWMSSVIFIVIAVAIAGTLLYNKKRVKNQTEEKNYEQD